MAFQDYMPDFTTGETEEERRKRLEEEARARGELPPVAPVAPIPSAEPLTAPVEEVTPIKQTITTDPKTGEQTMKLEGRVEDLSAANPLTPTVTGPAVPEQPPVQQPPVQQPQMAAPQAPVAPVSPEAAMPQPQPEAQPTAGPQLGQKPQPKPLTPQQQARLPGAAPQAIPPGPTTFSDIQGQETPVGGAPGFQPAVQQGPVNPAAPQPAAAPAPQTAPQPMAQPQPSPWEQKLTQAKTTQDYETLLTDPATPQALRPTIAKAYSESLQRDDKQRQAEKQLNTMTPTDLARVMSKKSEEGSYLKAILFARLGLNDLARSEQQKLDTSVKFESMMGADGLRYTALVGSQGGITQAFDAQGRAVDQDTIAMLNTQPSKAGGVRSFGQVYKGDDGQVYTLNNLGQFISPEGKNKPADVQITGTIKGEEGLATYAAKKEIASGYKSVDAMLKENREARQLGLTKMPHSEAEISAAKKAAVSTAGVIGSDLSPGLQNKISSGFRSTADQQRLWDESVAAGHPGKTAQGMPIARPGTSQHQAGKAVDFLPSSLNKDDRLELAQKGYYQPHGIDSVHWEKIPGSDKPVTTAAASSPATTSAPVAGRTATIAEKIANYEMKAPASRSASYGPLMREVMRLNPDYDETRYATVQQARKSFTTGKQGDSVRSMNVAIDHLETLHDAGQALRNGNLPLFNDIANKYSQNTGEKVVTDFNGIKSIVGSEVAKAVSGGQMALADREEIRKELSAANSPEQLNGVIRRLQQLLGGQLKGLKAQYEDAGLKDFDKKLTPNTKKVLGLEAPQTKQTRSNW